MTSDEFSASPGFDLSPLIRHLAFPATTRQIVDAARAAHSDPNAIETLERLPERTWQRAEEAVAAATSGWEPEGSPGVP